MDFDIAQIGIIVSYHSSNAEHCIFWAVQDGAAQYDDCTHLTDDTYYYLSVHHDSNDINYVIDDCGSAGGYTNCTTESSDQPIYNSQIGVVSSENMQWCDQHQMGSTSDAVNVGVPSGDLVQGLGDSGMWATRSFTPNTGSCSSYNSHQDGGGTNMYYSDSRNTS
jgi:hypothetical protein